MGCHTVGYFNVKSMDKDRFDEIKSYCDKCADKDLADIHTPEEIYNLVLRNKLNITFEKVKYFLKCRREKAQHYKDNIEKDRTLIRYYINTRDIDNEVYVSYESFLDWYIRVNNNPEGLFKSAEEIIKMCEKDNWESAYWFDEENGHIVRAKSDVREAKERIKQIFKDYPNVVVEFG